MTKQIAELTTQLAEAKAASASASASPNKAQIEKILTSIKEKKTYNNETYTIIELDKGFHIKLTEKVPATPAVSAPK